MLESLLKRDDVLNFIKQIKTNERYFKKNSDNFSNYYLVDVEIALYIFYDALLKYQIILADIYLFDEYLEQLEKIYKKIDNFDDIRVGINKLIGKMTTIKLGIKSINSELDRKQIISFIYNKYILEGYFIHGFNSSYIDKLKNEDFIAEEYENFYSDFLKLNKIFAKNNVINIIPKDFSKKDVYYTDDVVLGCYYSSYSPLFFYNFLNNKDYFGKGIRVDNSLKVNYNAWTRKLKRFMNDSFFSESDKNFVMELVRKQWDFLHKKEKKISLMLVKRKYIYDENVSLEYYLNDDSDIYNIIDGMLSSKYGNILNDKVIDNNNFEIIELDDYFISDESKLEEASYEDKYKEDDVRCEFLNVYGKASIFILLGSLFIFFGVIMTIFMFMRGI